MIQEKRVGINFYLCRSPLKNWILVQGQGGLVFQPGGILSYFEELKREPNAEIGPKDIFEKASKGGQLERPHMPPHPG